MLYKLRELGFSARALEMGDGVGGTWYWNRYPGARVDVQSIEYSYSLLGGDPAGVGVEGADAPQPELEAYLNFVADRLDLRRDISSGPGSRRWRSTRRTRALDRRDRAGPAVGRQFVVGATGCLSAPTDPDIPGLRLVRGRHAVHQPVPEGGLRLHRPAGRRRRYRLVRGAVDPGHRRGGRAPVGVPALGRLLAPGRQPAARARRIRAS